MRDVLEAALPAEASGERAALVTVVSTEGSTPQKAGAATLNYGLFINAIVSGLLLGGFYAAVTLGLAIAFGQLDIVNIAHPAFVIVGSYTAYMLGSRLGLDPVASGLVVAPVFFCIGVVVYRIYYLCFERTGQESLSGLAAWEPTPWLRVYGGGGWIIDPVPRSYGEFFLQYGAEVRSTRTLFDGYARPFAALDVQHYDATDWQADVSLKGGLELRDPDEPGGVAVRLMLELYSGRNPNGQFFAEDVEYAGVGLQIDF